jgi:hypothetical protein
MFRHKNAGRIVAAASVVGSFLLMAAGCQQSTVGETVPAPPRALAEESLKRGNAPNPQPGGGGPPAGAAGTRP